MAAGSERQWTINYTNAAYGSDIFVNLQVFKEEMGGG
jgi:hypothetical protein